MSKKAQMKQQGFTTMNDLMDAIEVEIESIKNGELSESKARIVSKNRQLQLQGMQLILQAARIEARFRNELAKRIGLPSSSIESVIQSKPLQ